MGHANLNAYYLLHILNSFSKTIIWPERRERRNKKNIYLREVCENAYLLHKKLPKRHESTQSKKSTKKDCSLKSVIDLLHIAWYYLIKSFKRILII